MSSTATKPASNTLTQAVIRQARACIKLPPEPRTTGRVELIQVGRGVAACVVALYHCARHLNVGGHAPHLMSLLQFGHAGVDLFFVISGFVITHVH